MASGPRVLAVSGTILAAVLVGREVGDLEAARGPAEAAVIAEPVFRKQIRTARVGALLVT